MVIPRRVEGPRVLCWSVSILRPGDWGACVRVGETAGTQHSGRSAQSFPGQSAHLAPAFQKGPRSHTSPLAG